MRLDEWNGWLELTRGTQRTSLFENRWLVLIRYIIPLNKTNALSTPQQPLNQHYILTYILMFSYGEFTNRINAEKVVLDRD